MLTRTSCPVPQPQSPRTMEPTSFSCQPCRGGFARPAVERENSPRRFLSRVGCLVPEAMKADTAAVFRIRPWSFCGACEPVCQPGGGEPVSAGTVECCPSARASDFCFFALLSGARFLLNGGKTDGGVMDVLYETCAGLDVSKRDAKACVRVTASPRQAAKPPRRPRPGVR
jgi:hypothetical protein